MFVLDFVLLSAAHALAAPVDLFEHISAEVAAERVSQCGLGPVTTRYDDELQSEVLTAANSSSATDEQLACADRAVSYHHLELSPEVHARFAALRDARWSAHMLAQATAWVSERGLLDRVPRYEAGVTDDAAFARQVERLCGPRAAGAFQAQFGFHVISPAWHRRRMRRQGGDEVFACLISVATVAGLRIGFVGNEAPSR